MRKKLSIFVCIAAVCLSALTGCGLAQESASVETTGKTDEVAGTKVVGVFITKEPLETSNKIYAELVTETDEDGNVGEAFLFPQLDGYSAFTQYEGNDYLTIASDGDDEYFFDINSARNVNANVWTDSYEVSCYVNGDYLENHEDNEKVVFVNPIFQDAEGKLYTQSAESGTYVGHSESEGELLTSESYTAQVTVESKGEQKELNTKVTVHMGVNRTCTEMELAVYNQKDEIVERKEMKTADAPEKLKVAKDAEYMIVTYRNGGKKTGTKLIDLNTEDQDDDVVEIDYFWGTSDNFLLKSNVIEVIRK